MLNNLRGCGVMVGMKVRVLIAVVTIAVAVHALIFIALGRVAKGKGPLIPVVAPTAAAAPTAKSAPTATSAATARAAVSPAAQSRKPIKHSRRPVFDLTTGGATTTDAPSTQ